MTASAKPTVGAPLLRASGVSLRLPGQSIPSAPVSLELHSGDVLSLEGASGSGKSTVLRCLAQLEARSEGDVEFLGRAIDDADVPAFRGRVVYVAQRTPPLPGTVERSLAAVFKFRVHKAEFDRSRAAQLCDKLALPSDVLSRELRDTSGGEQQRIAFVRALLLDPRVLLLDEPTSALDPTSADKVSDAFGEWLAGGERAAIVVSHGDSMAAHITRSITVAAAGADAAETAS